ncbi:MAG: hypothetical protein A4S09_01485 [Proteobacteria bacterium SG_bin7]|nr:MAG: hypothetical protein A4S09_01485 [Proteobacteria bacterium SG_bin7]
MRFNVILCLLLCTLGTAAYCDEQADARSFSSEVEVNQEDPNLLLSPSEASLIPDSPEIDDPVFGAAKRRPITSKEPNRFGSRK